jgi:hypothetical protein
MHHVNISGNALKVFAPLPGLKNGILSEKKTDSQEKYKVVLCSHVIPANVTYM